MAMHRPGGHRQVMQMSEVGRGDHGGAGGNGGKPERPGPMQTDAGTAALLAAAPPWKRRLGVAGATNFSRDSGKLNLCTQMFTAAPNKQQPSCPSAGDRLNK